MQRSFFVVVWPAMLALMVGSPPARPSFGMPAGNGQPRDRFRDPFSHAGTWLLLTLLMLNPGQVRAASDAVFERVAAQARALAQAPYRAPAQIPAALRTLSYDQYRDIRYRPSQALWKAEGLPFQVQFFHPGFFFTHSVQIHVIEAGGTRELPYAAGRFDFGKNRLGPLPGDLGYAGLRIHAPLNRPDYYDELAVFLGASYFRSLGRGENYGLSARGIAIDTAAPGGEEFPAFREFWLVKPQPGARLITLYALLDGPSLSGAYRFDITPGTSTQMAVRARLFFRRTPQVLGIAPLTSMFWHGENSWRHFNDFRPEVHDSDGLAIVGGTGERIWRPLSNPQALRVSAFQFERLRGFGLVQRDRDFDHYQDLEAHYHQRPSAWVTPQGEWGAGELRLVEIPTPDETNDNIVAFWMPKRLPQAGGQMELAYRIDWGYRPAEQPAGGYVLATRRSPGDHAGGRRYIVDFAGGELDKLATAPQGVVTVGAGGKLLKQQVERNPATGGWRLSFQVQPPAAGPLELRAFLKQGARTLTETWSYLES